jgi:hypothetical protein
MVKNDSLNDILIDIMSSDKYINQTSDRAREEAGFEVVAAHELSNTSVRGRSPSSPEEG